MAVSLRSPPLSSGSCFFPVRMLIELYFSLFIPRSAFRLVHLIASPYITLIPYIDMLPHSPFLSAIARSPPRPVSTSPAPTSLALHPSIQAAFGIDDLQFITRLNKTFPL